MRKPAISSIARAAIAAGLSGAAWLATAHAAGPAAPVTWSVEAGAGECTLTGTTGSATPTTLKLHTVTGTERYRLTVTGRTVSDLPPDESFTVTLVLGADLRFKHRARGAKLSGALGNAVIVSDLGPEDVAVFAQSSSIAIEGKVTAGPFALTHARAATKALAGCVRDQLVVFGADPAQFQPGGKTPVALIPRDDWLPRAEARRLVASDGAVDAAFRVSVAADGSVDDCAVVAGRVTADTQKAVCGAVLTRRLFTPASDAAGRPVRGAAMFELHLRPAVRSADDTD